MQRLMHQEILGMHIRSQISVDIFCFLLLKLLDHKLHKWLFLTIFAMLVSIPGWVYFWAQNMGVEGLYPCSFIEEQTTSFKAFKF